MTKTVFVVVLFLLSITSNAAVPIIGEAYSMDGKELLYLEYHCYSEDGLTHLVSYKNADDVLIADKTISYLNGLTSPSFIQENYQTQNSIQVKWKNNTIVILDAKRDTKKNLTPDLNYPLVIDAGFDHFIRQNWQDLTTKKSVIFNFLLAQQGRFIKLKTKKISCKNNTDHNCFSLTPKSWVIGLFSSPIKLEYNQERQLVRYRGLSNMEDNNGKGLSVDIHYRYINNP